MRILVPLDGSTLAERALLPAAQIAHAVAEPGTVTLLSVVPVPYVWMSMPGAYSSIVDQRQLQDAVASRQAYLNAVAQHPPLRETAVTTLVSSSSLTAETIVEQARILASDLIVMSSHGHTGLARLALGSVAEAVARDAHIPTLIVRSDHPVFPPADRSTPLTMLVPLDGTELAEQALEPAAHLARAFHGAIRLLRVLPPQVTSFTHVKGHSQQAYAYLATIARPLEEQGVIVHRALAWGDPVDEIVREAEQTENDLLVLATHGRVGLDRFLNGSITEAVFHRVQRPVLILHPSTEG